MKSSVSVVLFAILLAVGCGRPSKEEAVAEVQKLPDYSEIVQTMTINGALWGWSEVEKASPALTKRSSLDSFYSYHTIIYRTKTGGLRIATLDWNRPPVLTGLSEELK